jgi:hypothetical protein
MGKDWTIGGGFKIFDFELQTRKGWRRGGVFTVIDLLARPADLHKPDLLACV